MTAVRCTLLVLLCVIAAGCGARGPEGASSPRQHDDDAAASAARPARPAEPATAFRLEGPLEQRGAGVWVVDGLPVLVDDDAQPAGAPAEGSWVVLEGRQERDGVRVATLVGVQPVVELTGRLDSLAGELWVIDGTPVRVGAALQPAPLPAPGSFLRVVARIERGQELRLVALRVAPARELLLIGQLQALDPAGLTLDGVRLALTPDSLLPQGLAVGALVRVALAVGDDGALLVRAVTLLPAMVVVEGPIEQLDDGAIVVGGRRLLLGPRLLLVRVELLVGRPVRVILSDDGSLVIAIVALQVAIVAPAPQLVVVAPPAPPPPPARLLGRRRRRRRRLRPSRRGSGCRARPAGRGPRRSAPGRRGSAGRACR